jgi:hypothetical protein
VNESGEPILTKGCFLKEDKMCSRKEGKRGARQILKMKKKHRWKERESKGEGGMHREKDDLNRPF